MYKSFLNQIDTLAGMGKAIISANECNVVEIVKETIKSGRSASFYLTHEQAQAVKAWYWTPERIKASKLEPVSSDEMARIKDELDIDIKSFRCSRIQCECGHVYGGFEFLQQGLKEHGGEAVRAVFDLKNSMFLQANPTFIPICPNCNQMMRGPGGDGIEYDCEQYGGCCCCAH
ncbi:hypothetical protein IIO_02875 [Bacillus cereus VD115]|nr:hypothetical protein IIO_02875 [Bacillus cereus VD115]